MDSNLASFLACLAASVFGLGLVLVVAYGLYFLVTLPFRRLERARFFLDLLENGLGQGQTPERTIIDLGQCRDRSLGSRFHLLAAHLEKGLRLGQALDKVPRLLPPPMVAMLKAGEEIGDVGTVLPACRRMLRDGNSQVRSAFNYVIIMFLVLVPVFPAIFFMLQLVVIPKYKAIFEYFSHEPLTSATQAQVLFPQWLVTSAEMLVGLQIALMLGVYLLAFIYVGGPRVSGWLNRVFGALAARVAWLLPWRQRRMRRDFAGLLAVLLDAGVPEEKAVSLAAQATANSLFIARAQRVILDLRAGLKLTDAVQRLDDSGEFKWRLTNAVHSRGGFLEALNGWLEALDAKAFQQEQAASQLMTTGLVLINGVIVAFVAAAIFVPLIALVNLAELW